jgi:hypothetical protein
MKRPRFRAAFRTSECVGPWIGRTELLGPVSYQFQCLLRRRCAPPYPVVGLLRDCGACVARGVRGRDFSKRRFFLGSSPVSISSFMGVLLSAWNYRGFPDDAGLLLAIAMPNRAYCRSMTVSGDGNARARCDASVDDAESDASAVPLALAANFFSRRHRAVACAHRDRTRLVKALTILVKAGRTPSAQLPQRHEAQLEPARGAHFGRPTVPCG